MPQYKAPGVYIEEIESGPKPIAGVSTSVAGFLGRTERGPTDPQLLTSFTDYQRTFGGYAQYKRGGRLESTYLAYAIEGFFRNGGGRCYVGRIVPKDAVGDEEATADATLPNDTDEAVMTAKAVGPGVWGHNIVILVENATRYAEGENELFQLTVKYWAEEGDVPKPADPSSPTEEEIKNVVDEDADVEEVYDNLSTRQGSSNFYETQINDVSNLITVEQVSDGRPLAGDGTSPEMTILNEPTRLVGPDENVVVDDYEGNTEKGQRTGLAAFKEVDEISIVCAPDEVKDSLAGLTAAVKNHCVDDDLQDRVAVLSAPQSFDIDDPELPVHSSYAAFYLPWIKVRDPVTNALKAVPPAGHVAGIYARSDAERGVHKAPANEIVRGARELEMTITQAEQASLNPRGINCIRTFRGRGTRVWGARTTASDPIWKYVNVRRLFLFVEESIDEGTQWVVFEPNSERLWARVRQSVRNFLTEVWRDGALMGTTPEEAFYVKCDRSTMTQNDIDNGRLICEIGIAPVKPAEFVIFRISQTTAGGEE